MAVFLAIIFGMTVVICIALALTAWAIEDYEALLWAIILCIGGFLAFLVASAETVEDHSLSASETQCECAEGVGHDE